MNPSIEGSPAVEIDLVTLGIMAHDKQELSRVSGPVEARARMAEITQIAGKANRLRGKARAENTVLAYEKDWRHFTAWCARLGLDPLPALPEVVALYVADHQAVHKVATIRRRLASISVRHQREGHETPTTDVVVHETIAGLTNEQARDLAAAVTRKAPARTVELRKMIATLDLDRLAGSRDRAILLVGYAGAFRRSEVVRFDVHHVQQRGDGLAVRLPWSKTNQQGQLEEVGIPYGSDPLTCPVRAWRDWLEASGVTEGPPFRPIDRWGRMAARRLSGAAVADVVKRAARAAGYNPEIFAGHSLRAGLITNAAENDVPERDIMRQSRHQSIPVMRQYIRSASLFKDNAAARVGL